MMETTLS